MSLKNNTLFLALSNSVNVSVTFILSIALARYFESKDIYGKFQQLYMIIPFFIALTSGIPLALSYYHGRYLKFTDRIFIHRRFFILMIIATLISAIIIVLCRNYLSSLFNNEYFVIYAILFGIILFFKVLNTYFINYTLISNQIRTYFIITIFSFFIFSGFIWLIFHLSLSIKQILIGVIAQEVLKGIIFFSISYRRLILPKMNTTWLVRKGEILYILPLTGVALMNIGNLFVDKYMIAGMLDAKAFADYQVGAFTVPFIGIITGSIVTALLPVFSKLNIEGNNLEIIRTWRKATSKATLLLLPIFIYSIGFGTHIITFFYGEQYEIAGTIFRLYSLRFLFSVVLFSLTMSAIGLQNWIAINSLINFLLNATLNFFMIKSYGVFGAVFATIISTYVGMIYPIYLIKRQIGAGFLDYFPLKDYLIILGISLLLVLIFILSFHYFKLSDVFPIVFSPVYYMICLAIGVKAIYGYKLNLLSLIQRIY